MRSINIILYVGLSLIAVLSCSSESSGTKASESGLDAAHQQLLNAAISLTDYVISLDEDEDSWRINELLIENNRSGSPALSLYFSLNENPCGVRIWVRERTVNNGSANIDGTDLEIEVFYSGELFPNPNCADTLRQRLGDELLVSANGGPNLTYLSSIAASNKSYSSNQVKDLISQFSRISSVVEDVPKNTIGVSYYRSDQQESANILFYWLDADGSDTEVEKVWVASPAELCAQLVPGQEHISFEEISGIVEKRFEEGDHPRAKYCVLNENASLTLN